MSVQSGLLHTWSQMRKTMKWSLRRMLAPESTSLPKNFQDLNLVLLYTQLCDRGSSIASILKMQFNPRFDVRLPLVIRGNAALLLMTVSTLMDNVMGQYAGVGYTAFEANLTEQADWDYVSFTIWRTGIYKDKTTDDGFRIWFDPSEVQRLAALMGGRFFVEDQESMEPRYTISIPLIPGDLSIIERTPLAASIGKVTQAKEGTTALVVDDSHISRILGVHLLSRHNITAEVAENGHVALEQLTVRHYDLVFMDDSMPVLDGAQTVASAKKKGLLRNSLVIGLNSNADSGEHTASAFSDAGMDGHLAKPVDPLELELLLRDMLPHLHNQAVEAPKQENAPEIAQKNTPVTADSTRKSLFRALSDATGLNTEKGLANAGGNKEIYAGLLRRFTSELTEYIESLLTLSLDGSWEEVAIRLHVLRDFFVGIGAEELARDAAALAAEADAGGGAGCMPRIQSHCDDMMRLRAKLLKFRDDRKRTVVRHAGGNTRVEKVDLATLKQHVSRLHDACLAHRATEAQATADILRRVVLREDMADRIENICALVDSFDYHEAQERCAHVLETLKS